MMVNRFIVGLAHVKFICTYHGNFLLYIAYGTTLSFFDMRVL